MGGRGNLGMGGVGRAGPSRGVGRNLGASQRASLGASLQGLKLTARLRRNGAVLDERLRAGLMCSTHVGPEPEPPHTPQPEMAS